MEGGKPEYLEIKPQSKVRNNNKLNPHTYDTGPEWNTGHAGGEQALSSLHLIPTPLACALIIPRGGEGELLPTVHYAGR